MSLFYRHIAPLERKAIPFSNLPLFQSSPLLRFQVSSFPLVASWDHNLTDRATCTPRLPASSFSRFPVLSSSPLHASAVYFFRVPYYALCLNPCNPLIRIIRDSDKWDMPPLWGFLLVH